MAKQILQVRRVRFAARFVIVSSVLLMAAVSGFAKAEARLSTHQLESKSLERTIPYNVILPKGYADAANSGKKYPVLYLLHGLTGHYDAWVRATMVEEHSIPYELVIVMPEGNNGWYTNAENVPADRYEDYMVKDLIPEIEKKFRVQTDRSSRMIAGLSMGGYGALKFGLKYPGLFAIAGSFSGALNAARFDTKVLPNTWKALVDSITAVYGDMGSKTRAENDVHKIIEEITPDSVKSLPFIYVDCGTEDMLINTNREFVAKLLEKKVPHEFRQLPGGHNAPYWNKQILEFLEMQDRLRGSVAAASPSR